MNFCDCGNLLVGVAAAADSYFECMVCKKRHPLKEGDTLMRPPAIKPTGHDKVEHITRYLSRKHIFSTVSDKPCPACQHQYAKVYIDGEEGVAWYGCLKCDHVYQ